MDYFTPIQPDHMEQKLLIYGANGYTGQLICEIAAQKGLHPVLAGRSESNIKPLSEKYQWEYRIFSLDSIEGIISHLHGVSVVLHAAGPFRFTAEKMILACIEKGVHYLDITGEIEVFALAFRMDIQAKEKQIMLLPGTGFDVVPTDCMALRLKEKMPDAETLELAFVTLGGQVSHGTAMSMTAKLGEGGACRKDGKLTKEPLGKFGKTLSINGKNAFVMSIPWGDVFTAYHTTGIGNIHAYTGIPKSIYYLMKFQFLFNPLLRTEAIRNWMRKKIDNRPAGPTPEKRAKAKSYIWGEVTNAAGQKTTDWFTCPEGYTLTALAAVAIAQKVLNGQWKPGYQTPAGCYGSGLIDEILS
jgi:short subunit dehydrogenase-like uncharacterized protein